MLANVTIFIIFITVKNMRATFFLDRINKKETAKAQLFYVFVCLFEGMIISFLTIFLNECRNNLAWNDLMSSFSLFLPPFGAAIGIFICSFLVSHQEKNLKIMRWITLLSFICILTLSLLGLFLPNGLDNNGNVINPGQFYGLFSIFLIFPSILMGLHWAFLSFNVSCSSDINIAEKSKYGHVCLYGPLVAMLASPLAGYLAECYLTGYKGYLFLFLLSSPLALIVFGLTYIFKPFPSSMFHSDSDERVHTKVLLKNKTYLFYLFLASLWIPLIWASDSLSSSLWSNYESSTSTLNAFNPLSWGLYISISYLFEFITIFINTHFGIGKKVRFSLSLALILISIETLLLGLLSYYFKGEENASLGLTTSFIFIHSLKGVASGLYVTSNLSMLNHILGPKLRRKAVFIAPLIFQLVNSVLQLIYPYFDSNFFIPFFVMSVLAFTGFLLSIFLDVHILHHPEIESK